jgi:hypothetical protein
MFTCLVSVAVQIWLTYCGKLQKVDGFIHICNTNKCTYKSIHKLYCFLLSPNVKSHIVLILDLYLVVKSVSENV